MDSITVGSPNSLVLLLDSKNGQIPSAFDSDGLVAASPTGIAVGIRQSEGAETKLSVGYTVELTGLIDGLTKVSAGIITTESGSLVVGDLSGKTYFQRAVRPVAQVAVYVDDPARPANIVISTD